IYINNIIIASNFVDNYLKYLNTIFSFFISKNIVLLLKKLYLGYFSVELLGFYVNNFGLLTIRERIKAFKYLVFPSNLKVLE
ncbi:hypothetical protein GE21DRAFT_1207011, partial [Neurospora crassa]